MAAKKAKKKHPHGKKHHNKGRSHTKAHRSANRTAHRKAHHKGKCPACGHVAQHDAKVGCTHFDGQRFCPCKHRHR